MAEVLRSGFKQPLHSRVEVVRPSAKWFALVGCALLTPCLATAQGAPARNPKKDAPAAATPAPIAQPANLAARPVTSLPPIEPARPPIVSWDGKLLTIDAENAMLSDVLLAIRSRTGASIEMPGSASGERVAIHVGPAPIRDVLSSLLYGTNFNYVIQSSEDDASGLGKVMLISRDGESSDDAAAVDERAGKNIRLMPGYGAPGKRDFEVAHTRAMQEAAENQATADSANQESAPAATNEAGTTETPSTDTQPVASNSNSTDSSSAQPDTSLTAAEQPLSRSATGITSSGETSAAADGSPSMANMEQNLQKLYEQRRQIQAQQNKNTPQTPPSQ